MPARSLRKSLEWVTTFGREIKRRYKIGLVRQFVYQQYLALKYRIPVDYYYKYRFYLHASKEVSVGYMYREQIISILGFVNRTLAEADTHTLNDKRLFFRQCQKNNIDTVPILAEFADGKSNISAQDLNEVDSRGGLFSKPAFGVCGQGTSRWLEMTPGTYEGKNGRALTGRELIDHLSRLSEDGPPLILQKCIFNHPEIAALSGGALSTLRIVTCRTPSGEIENLLSVFRMATGESCTDNFAQGGIASPIDPETGLAGNACAWDPRNSLEPIDAHPDTGHSINGFKIPFWQESLDLAIKTHRTFDDIPFVGWDIAVTETGPLVLEGNPVWGVELVQIVHNSPILHTEFGAYLRHYMENAMQMRAPVIPPEGSRISQ